jgi:hypothetical protein
VQTGFVSGFFQNEISGVYSKVFAHLSRDVCKTAFQSIPRSDIPRAAFIGDTGDDIDGTPDGGNN